MRSFPSAQRVLNRSRGCDFKHFCLPRGSPSTQASNSCFGCRCTEKPLRRVNELVASETHSRRIRDPPKLGARLHKIDSDFFLLPEMRIDIGNATEHLFSALCVPKRQQLPHRHLWVRTIIAPCAFTVMVRVSSEMILSSAPCDNTTTETFNMTRWLRR